MISVQAEVPHQMSGVEEGFVEEKFGVREGFLEEEKEICVKG